MKIGRNAPCPCGSGKKYKKCCIDIDNINETYGKKSYSSSFDSTNSANKIPDGIQIRPYVMSNFLEPDSESAKHLLKKEPHFKKKMKNIWVPSKVRALSTKQIIQYLDQRGVLYNQDVFLQKCHENDSAWDVAKQLWPKQAESSSRDISDFTCLASCILWERLYENGNLEKISYEILDDWIGEGYEYFEKDEVQACKIWIKAWTTFKSLFDLSNLTINEIDNIFIGSQSLYNWCQDFEMSIMNSSIDSKDFHNEGIKYFTEFLEYFSYEDNPNIIQNMQMSLGELYCRSENQEKGEQIMQEMIDKHPDKVQGYIGLETALSHRKNMNHDQICHEQLKVLETAKKYSVIDGDDYDLDFRIDELKKEIRKMLDTKSI